MSCDKSYYKVFITNFHHFPVVNSVTAGVLVLDSSGIKINDTLSQSVWAVKKKYYRLGGL